MTVALARPAMRSAPRIHPVLARLFAALEERDLSWVMLRRPSDLAAPSGDVDLLVAPEHAASLRDAAQAIGFAALPGWERPPNLILVRYDEESNRWLVLDVVTELFADGVAEEVLRNTWLDAGIREPADADAFWLLLMHCVLEKDAVAERHRRRLAELAPGAEKSALADLVPPRPPRRRGTLIRRLLRKPLLMRRRRGVSVALVGPNGVGKSTLAQELARHFPFESRIVYMGLWKGGGIANPFRIWRRYLLAEIHRERGRLVIFDRYVYEATLPARPPLAGLKRAYHWLLLHAVPTPDVVVLLDVDGEVAYRRKQENPPDELEWERSIYRRLASRLSRFEIVDGSRGRDEVRAEVTAIVWRAIAARWRGSNGPAREGGGRALADACALVPRIVAEEPASAAGGVVECARVTSTGRAIITLDPTRAAIKLQLGADDLRREHEVLAALHAEWQLDGWRRLVPRPLAAGSVVQRPYAIETALAGRPPLQQVRDPVMRARILEQAAAAIATLHERTARTRAVDADLVEAWVDAPLEDLTRSGAGRHPLFEARARRLRDELTSAVAGRSITTSWVHGDYWPSNLLFAPEDLTLTGIVDWDAADPAGLPVHDLLHLVLATRRLMTGEELGRIVKRLLRAPDFSAEELEILHRFGHGPPERYELLLYWLRHTALHARQNRASAGPRYRLWELRNVHAVLGAL